MVECEKDAALIKILHQYIIMIERNKYSIAYFDMPHDILKKRKKFASPRIMLTCDFLENFQLF
jgi:hypothetical protein